MGEKPWMYKCGSMAINFIFWPHFFMTSRSHIWIERDEKAQHVQQVNQIVINRHIFKQFSWGLHDRSFAGLLFFGLLHLQSRTFHRGNNLFLIFCFEPFLLFLVDRISSVFVFIGIVGLIVLLPDKVFVGKFDAMDRITKFETTLKTSRKPDFRHSRTVCPDYSSDG